MKMELRLDDIILGMGAAGVIAGLMQTIIDELRDRKERRREEKILKQVADATRDITGVPDEIKNMLAQTLMVRRAHVDAGDLEKFMVSARTAMRQAERPGGSR